MHPAKPKTGLRTARANEMWYINTTVVRLLDGTRAYLHAVIDNLSRRILAWRVADAFAPTSNRGRTVAGIRSPHSVPCIPNDENSRAKVPNVDADSSAHEQGVPGKVVAELMGHVKVDTTLNVYTQVVDGALRTAVDTIDCSQLFGGDSGHLNR